MRTLSEQPRTKGSVQMRAIRRVKSDRWVSKAEHWQRCPGHKKKKLAGPDLLPSRGGEKMEWQRSVLKSTPLRYGLELVGPRVERVER